MKIASDEPTPLNNKNMLFKQKKKECMQNTVIHDFSICNTRGIPQEIFNLDPKAFSYFMCNKLGPLLHAESDDQT